MQPVMGSLATLEWSIHKIGGDELHLDLRTLTSAGIISCIKVLVLLFFPFENKAFFQLCV